VTIEMKTARLAGLLYLIVVVTGIFTLAYVPSRIVLSGEPQSVIANVTASETLFRFGIAGFIVNQVAFLLLPLVLYRLLRPVGETAAALMVVLSVISVPIALVSLSSRMDVLAMVTDARYAALGAEQLQAMVLFALGEYRSAIRLTMLFWGLWLFPFGYLVFKSGFLPRILGVLLILGCFGYATEVFGDLLIPGYAASAVPGFIRLPAAVGEIGTCLWLLIVGVRYRR
jgi:hypothetical protein